MSCHFNLSRRRVICAAVTLPIAHISRVEAAAITYLQGAGAAVGIIAGITGMNSDAALREQMQHIMSKLDVVISQQEAILNDLAKLRADIDASFLRSWQDSYGRDIVSYNKILQVCVNDLSINKWKLTKDLRETLGDLVIPVTYMTHNVGQLSFQGFASYATGVAATLAIERILNAPLTHVSKLKTQLAEPVKAWLDEKNARGLPALMQRTEIERATKRAYLDARPRTVSLRDERVSVDDNCSERYEEWVSVHGTFETGYTGQVGSKTSEKKCYPPPKDHCNWKCLLSLNDVTVERRALRRMLGPMLLADSQEDSIPAVPGFTPSGSVHVDTFNRERIEVFELMAAWARQNLLKGAMEALLGQLA